MKNQHTPGPWTIQRASREIVGTFCLERVLVCGKIAHAEDTNLIAAAPDLLAALQEVQALIAEPFDGRGNSSADKLRAINAMCAIAIAKAEGGEE